MADTDQLESSRREFISFGLFWTALTSAYGLFAWFSWRFLRPERVSREATMFVAFTDSVPIGGSHSFTTPKGERFLVTRVTAESFSAFSSRCPHLGCKVHWEAQANRFFCPCHAGAFDAAGMGIEGPPKGKLLKSCKLIVKGSALYAMVEP